eukprot:TRINITY_DN15599_c0_g1_i2.p1 TRINITY_DN15599_c0_g1~~TRINITY_DN15599_c0_g1_i2.p1  ORF type:complete len:273 (-),score=67.20 TRINITY_DN15599_c0_g1_i2:63-881(-)
MQSASWGHVACVEALIDGGADICAKDPGGKTAIFLGKVHKQGGCIEELQDRLNEQFCEVCASGEVERMKLMLDCGAEPNLLGVNGTYPLCLAAARKDPNMVNAMLSSRTAAGARIKTDVCDANTGMTPLCHAARANNHLAVLALLEARADCAMQDSAGRSALNHAQKNNKPKCVRLLQAAASCKTNQIKRVPETKGSSVSKKEDINSFASLVEDSSPVPAEDALTDDDDSSDEEPVVKLKARTAVPVVAKAKSKAKAQKLSLIHISEPTRPY